jgi:hypothetical protein
VCFFDVLPKKWLCICFFSLGISCVTTLLTCFDISNAILVFFRIFNLDFQGDKMRYLFVVLSMFLLNITFPSFAQQKDQRGGNCEQTKSQYEYFCTKKGDPAKDDIMTTANIACNNAKRNMAAACDGVSEKDAAYTFDKDGKPIAAQ